MTSTQMRADRDTLSVADVLDRAADLITPEGAWTQGYAARDKDGNPVRAFDAFATCFCMWGAIARVSGDYTAERNELLRPLTKPWGRASVPNVIGDWNDKPYRTQAQAVAELRSAAALARSGAL